MPKLDIYQSLWAMELRRPDGKERTMEESFAMIAEAGYKGVCIDLAAGDLDKAKKAVPLFKKHKLGCLLNAFPRTIEDLRPVLHFAKDMGSQYVNIIDQLMPISVDGMIGVIRERLAMARQEGMPILYETHRACLTNDLFDTLRLVDAIPELRLCGDLSHFLVDREFRYPISEDDNKLMYRILDRCDSFQGRIASREQVQVQITFPQNQKWFDVFAHWWEYGMRGWLKRAKPDDTLIFLCELGPPEYAITGKDGYELSDRWEEALIIRKRVESIWDGLQKAST
ncbi:MAG: sugar phosphate isomerase/epimerase [Alphaproteobacteria bacterium]